MQAIMGVSEVREFEAALAAKGLKAPELMRRAGSVVARQAARMVRGGTVVVLCGMGNNGGDGWVAADELASHGFEVNVVSAAATAVLKGDLARRAAAHVADMGIPVHVDPSRDELAALLHEADVVVDAVFGIGFKGTMPQPYAAWVDAVDEEFAGTLLSVDVPSGIDAETGMAAGAYFAADVTVTMFALKPGLVSGVGRQAAGRVLVAQLLAEDEGACDVDDAACAFLASDGELGARLPGEDPLQDKYSRGRVLVVAGSSSYPGAAVMCARAAARSGAGYVTLAVPAPVVPVAQAHLLTVPVVGLPADDEGAFAASSCDLIEALAAKADVVVAGPGLTTTFGSCELVRRLLALEVPLVLDADALNAAVKTCRGSAEANPQPLRREAPLVLTPHARELARLAGAELPATATFSGALRTARKLTWAVGSGNFAVLAKGPMSCVATIEGAVVPAPGPAALATAGTGDVLAGAVAALLAQRTAEARLHGEGPLDAEELMLVVAAADRVHALAGELAVAAHGSRGVVATDVIEELGRAFDLLAARAEEVEEPDDACDDELRLAPDPALELVLRADAEAARAGVQLPGEVTAYEGDLEEPDSAPVFALVPDLPEPAPAAGGAEDVEDAAGEDAPAAGDLEEPEPAPEADDGQVEGDPDDLDADADGRGGAGEPGDPGDPTPEVEPDDADDADDADAAPVEPAVPAPAPARTPAMPPFLARAVAASAMSGSADPSLTTVMPAVPVEREAPSSEDLLGLDLEPTAAVPDPELDPAPAIRPPKPTRSQVFHSYATRYAGDDEVTPVEERPSAHRGRQG